MSKIREEAEAWVDYNWGSMTDQEAAISDMAKRVLILLDALEFYANSEWNDMYPGGIDDGEYLDTGERARAAIRDAEEL